MAVKNLLLLKSSIREKIRSPMDSRDSETARQHSVSSTPLPVHIAPNRQPFSSVPQECYDMRSVAHTYCPMDKGLGQLLGIYWSPVKGLDLNYIGIFLREKHDIHWWRGGCKAYLLSRTWHRCIYLKI